MALINCPECNHEISDSAKSCPHCGFRIKKSNNKKVPIIIGVCLITIIVCVAVVLLNRSGLTPEQKAVSDVSTMIKNDLFNSDTFILYDAYVSEVWNEGFLSVFLHYGAESGIGGKFQECYAFFDGESLYYEDYYGISKIASARISIANAPDKWHLVEDFPLP